MRPRYCTAANIKNEKRAGRIFARIVKSKSPAEFRHNSDYPSMSKDYDGEIWTDGNRACLVEVKGRDGKGERYSTWHLSQEKVIKCLRHAKSFNLPLVLLFTWDEEVFFWVVKDVEKLHSEMGGRWDRGDRHDVEMMLHIPSSYFTKIQRRYYEDI